MLLKQIGGDIGQSIPMVCQDWANTKAAYRFFSNERVSEADILSGTLNRRGNVSRLRKVLFLSRMIRPSSPIKESARI